MRFDRNSTDCFHANRFIKALILIFSLVLAAPSGFAQEKILVGAQEMRARNLFKDLRCVVCQNQSIDGSNADVAKDLRQIVREQISDGRTDQQIKKFLVSRYGEFVLLKPTFALHTLLLWLSPFVLLLLGGFIMFRMRNSSGANEAALSPNEQAKVSDIMSKPNSQT